jgi:hypothetical protein
MQLNRAESGVRMVANIQPIHINSYHGAFVLDPDSNEIEAVNHDL